MNSIFLPCLFYFYQNVENANSMNQQTIARLEKMKMKKQKISSNKFQ